MIHASGISAKPDNGKLGFILFPAVSESGVSADIDSVVATGACALDGAYDGKSIQVIRLDDRSQWENGPPAVSFEVEGGGMFDLMFTHCVDKGVTDASVSFTLDYTFVNPGPNYLSAGEIPLPALYGALTVLFAALSAAWFWHARKNAADVQRVHYLMSLLVVTKTATLLVESLMYHFISLTGHSTGWNVVFYILNFLRGSLVIVVIALIGAGYSLIKPFLNRREKYIILIIVPLQVRAV